MPVTGDRTKNQLDKTESFSITGYKELDSGNTVSATAFANNVRQKHDSFRPNAPPYGNAGLHLGVENRAGSVGLTGTHIPDRANVLTASTNVHLVNNDTHKLTANAFTSTVIPKAGTNFSTHGGGVDYMYKYQPQVYKLAMFPQCFILSDRVGSAIPSKYASEAIEGAPVLAQALVHDIFFCINGANASVSHTPMFKQTDYSVGGRLNVHETPTSSLGLNIGANRTDTSFSKGRWEPGASFVFKKSF